MPRCGCGSISLPGCGCALQSGNGVNVTGIGSALAPYRVTANLDPAAGNNMQNTSQGLYVPGPRGLVTQFATTTPSFIERDAAAGTQVQVAATTFTGGAGRNYSFLYYLPCLATSYQPALGDTQSTLVKMYLKVNGGLLTGAVVYLVAITVTTGAVGTIPHGVPVTMSLDSGGYAGANTVTVTMERVEGNSRVWAFCEGGFLSRLAVYDVGFS